MIDETEANNLWLAMSSRVRDPRAYPMPGDVILREDDDGTPTTRAVLSVSNDGNIITFRQGIVDSSCPLVEWLRWAQTAVVNNRAEP